MDKAKYSLTQRTYITLKDWVKFGVLVPNRLYSESELGKKLGVSRSPVRSALQHLEGEGLIVRLPQRGYFVYPFSPEDVDNVYDVRKAIEGYAIEHLIGSEKDTNLFGEIRKNLDSQKEMLEKNDFQGFVEKDKEFHELLIKSVRNPRLERIFNQLRDVITIIGLRRLQIDKEGGEVLKEHKSMFKQIERQDSINSVKKLLYQHFDKAAHRIKSRVSSSG